MNHAKLLDCTLRDGAYLTDKKFGDYTIHGIINGLVKAKIDYIEIGFLQNEGFGEGKTVYKNASDAQKYIPKNKQGCEFAVLADYSRYSIKNLENYTGNSVDIIRECFLKDERFDAIDICRQIKEKGYKVFVQPVDILGYTDIELIEFINNVNEVEPYCFSIVDTFGSMYTEDLQRVYNIIDHNLISTCKIGFHSHNNLQMSNALSQSFLRMTYGNREVVVDGTISGMGRGAGNTPTELIAQYMVSKLGYNYDMDALLDVIDGYMNNIRSWYNWGYTTPYFIAGSYSAHVNNITYLLKKNSIRSKDIRYILNKIGNGNRKRYNYELLEKTYVEYIISDIDDTKGITSLKQKLEGKNILIIAPGNSVNTEAKKIDDYICDNNVIVITVNFIHDTINADYVYMNNVKRYNYWINSNKFVESKKILTSNVVPKSDNENEIVVSFARLVKCGWEHLDNSAIMLLRLLDELNVASIKIAGFDGYATDGKMNYASKYLEVSDVKEDPIDLNEEIASMIEDFICTRKSEAKIEFLTESRFKKLFDI